MLILSQHYSYSMISPPGSGQCKKLWNSRSNVIEYLLTIIGHLLEKSVHKNNGAVKMVFLKDWDK